MIHFHDAWIIRCYPISPRTHCTIASVSKSITNNNPVPAAKEEEEEGRSGTASPSRSPRCLHPPAQKCRPASPVLLGFAPIQGASTSGEQPSSKLGAGHWAPEGGRQRLGMLHRSASPQMNIWAGSCPATGISRLRRGWKINPHEYVRSPTRVIPNQAQSREGCSATVIPAARNKAQAPFLRLSG